MALTFIIGITVVTVFVASGSHTPQAKLRSKIVRTEISTRGVVIDVGMAGSPRRTTSQSAPLSSSQMLQAAATSVSEETDEENKKKEQITHHKDEEDDNSILKGSAHQIGTRLSRAHTHTHSAVAGASPGRHACSSAEVGAQVPKILKLRKMQSSDLGSSSAARSAAFETEVRRYAVPVLIKGTHASTPLRSFCDAVAVVPGTPVPSRVFELVGGYSNKLQRRMLLRGHKTVHRTFSNVSWQTFCNQISDHEVKTASVDSHANASTLSALYTKVHIPKEISRTGFAGLSHLYPSHGAPYKLESKLWMGSKGAQTPLHEDPLDNVAMQLSGMKRWHLFSPEHFREYKYLGFREPWSYREGHCSKNAKHSGVRWSKYHMLAPWARPPRPSHLVVEVQAGDSLYIPSFWGHMVESLETSLMTNYWFHDMWTCCGGAAVLKGP